MHFDLNMDFTVKIYMHRARTTHKHLIVSFSYMFSFFETGSHVASNFLRSGGLPRIYASPTSTDEENQRIICAYYQAKSVLGNHNKEWRIQNESPAAPLGQGIIPRLRLLSGRLFPLTLIFSRTRITGV